jgi:hypothetical protein
MNIKAVIMVLAGVAVGQVTHYGEGNGTAQAAVETTQPASTNATVTGAPKTTVTNWVKNNLLAQLEATYGIAAGTLTPCASKARVVLVWEQAPNNHAACVLSAGVSATIPGQFVAGDVTGE